MHVNNVPHHGGIVFPCFELPSAHPGYSLQNIEKYKKKTEAAAVDPCVIST